MISAFDNLANATVQKNDAVEALVITNENLTDSLTARDVECARLLTIITALSTGRNASVGGGGGGGGGGNDTTPPWDPDGFCWSHGFKCRVGHSSATCRNKK